MWAICICGCMCMTECACVQVEWFIWWLDICGFSWPVKGVCVCVCVCARAHRCACAHCEFYQDL